MASAQRPPVSDPASAIEGEGDFSTTLGNSLFHSCRSRLPSTEMSRMPSETPEDDGGNGSGAAHGEPARGPPPRRDWKIALAGVAGNVLEWFDFAAYGFFSDIIGKVFFPPSPEGSNDALVESFVVFGIAFLVRPIGGVVFGLVGDTVGRKAALENSILLMALPTVAMGCLPTFAAVGWLAPALLTLCRMLQGLSVGGQLMSSVVFTLEASPEEEWGSQAAKVMSAASCGTIVGSLLSYALRGTLNDDQLVSFGWRIPFFFGIAGIFPGWYLKQRQVSDCPSWPPREAGGEQNPLSEALGATNLRAMVVSTLVPMFSAGSYYMVFVWLGVYMESIVNVPHAFGINSAVSILGFVLIFAMGWLTDWFGHRILQMLLSSLTLALIAPVFIGWIGNGDPIQCFILQGTMGLLIASFSGALMPWIISNFPPHVRLTSVSVSYNIAMSLAGGFTPVVATLLMDSYGSFSPGYIITGLAVLAWVGLGVSMMDCGEKRETAAPSEEAIKTIVV